MLRFSLFAGISRSQNPRPRGIGIFEGPGEKQCEQEACRHQHQHRLHHPVGGAETLENQLQYLRHQPCYNDIGNGDPEYIPTLEFVEK
jgi:hypothetical protein